jgi:small subunit ribosomal protein S4
MSQARQFVVHGHVAVGERRVQVPSYKVDLDEESLVEFDESSPLTDDLHPERADDQ